MNRLILKYLNLKKILFWLFIFSFLNARSQNYFDSYRELLKTNLEYKIDSIIDITLINNKPEVSIKIAHDFSVKNYRKRNYKKALRYALKEIRVYEENNFFNENYINALYNVAFFYYKNYEYRKAIVLHEKVISKDIFNIKKGRSYAEIGRSYNKLGNYYKSISYYKKGIEILKANKSYKSLATHSLNLSTVYNNLKTEKGNKIALEILLKVDSLTKIHKVRINSYRNLQDALASQYTFNKNFKKAKYYYNKNLIVSLQNKDSLFLSWTYNNLASLYLINRKDSAEYFIKEGLNYVKDDHIKIQLYDNYATYYSSKSELDLALENIHRSLEISIGGKLELLGEIELNNLTNLQLPTITVSRLKNKANILTKLYIKNNDQKYLESTLKNVDAINNLTEIIQSGTAEKSTQLVWRREASQGYLYGAYAAHLLNDSETVFSFMEKNKALLLSESILKNTEFENLPKHISDQEISLQKQIYDLENKLSKNENNTILQDSLFNVKLVHENYVDSLKTVYPKYFDRKIDLKQVALSQVQKELKNNEALLSYIWNKFDEEKEILLGLVTTNSTSKTFEVGNVDSLRGKLIRYRELISKPFSTKEEQKQYQELAFELYQELFPAEVRSLLKKKNLTIIPDGDLQNIPFEAFITKENSNQYLMMDSNVSYAYSYSFLKHNEQVKRQANQSFIGYSPVEFTALILPSLKDSRRETVEVSRQFDGVTKLQQSATKEDFLTNSSQSKIIHLATHSDAGGNPWIAFSDGKLELHELYTYKNNADLVTLSACNTSLGEVAKGEGVLSLARGFFYSGSKSVVSSLWKVNDKSTSEIMIDFYKNLKEGQSKSDALNNAKRNYIDSHELSEQSPYYWSSFVLIGDAGELDLGSNTYLYLVLGFIILILFLFFRKKRIFQG